MPLQKHLVNILESVNKEMDLERFNNNTTITANPNSGDCVCSVPAVQKCLMSLELVDPQQPSEVGTFLSPFSDGILVSVVSQLASGRAGTQPLQSGSSL